MTTLLGSLQRVMADHRTAVILVISLIGLVVLGLAVPGLLEPARTAQIAVTFLVPATVMILFWRSARSRIREREAVFEAAFELERVGSRATGRFLADVAHELAPHQERCSVRAESLVVALDYQEVGVDLKVVVPELVVTTDPHLLRQILHILVGNAIRHGGHRVAIWGVAETGSVRLSVSDDGPGLPDEMDDRIFQRYLDLGEMEGITSRIGSGLAVAGALGEVIGGQLSYKRDPHWTHFSVSLPVGAGRAEQLSDLVAIRAGAR